MTKRPLPTIVATITALLGSVTACGPDLSETASEDGEEFFLEDGEVFFLEDGEEFDLEQEASLSSSLTSATPSVVLGCNIRTNPIRAQARGSYGGIRSSSIAKIEVTLRYASLLSGGGFGPVLTTTSPASIYSSTNSSGSYSVDMGLQSLLGVTWKAGDLVEVSTTIFGSRDKVLGRTGFVTCAPPSY